MGKFSGIADKRVRDLLEYHIDLLSRKNRSFNKNTLEEAYYLKELPHAEEDDYLRVGYSLKKKLLTRTFNFEIVTTLNEIYFKNPFILTMKFTGFPDIQAAYFKGKKGESSYEAIFNDKKLVDRIIDNARKVDIGYVRVEYQDKAGKLIIKVCPYAGAFLWILVPPILQKIPLNKKELDALWSITMDLRNFAAELRNR